MNDSKYFLCLSTLAYNFLSKSERGDLSLLAISSKNCFASFPLKVGVARIGFAMYVYITVLLFKVNSSFSRERREEGQLSAEELEKKAVRLETV